MVDKEIVIKSFNGIGDLLFVTPTLRVIKQTYPDCRIVVNTNRPELLINNPFVDVINRDREGVFLGYPDPIHRKHPTQHHIISDWEIVTKHYGLVTERPELKPEIYLPFKHGEGGGPIGVQVFHKGHWDGKKVWDGFPYLAAKSGFRKIPKCASMQALCEFLTSCKGVVCAEGGISHLCRALDVPCIVIYGGFADPKWNGYKEQINVQQHTSCSYCYGSQACERPNGVYKLCMKQITVAQVQGIAAGLSKCKWVEHHNQMTYIETEARKWCLGKGVDIGAGNHAFPGARPINDNEFENAYSIDRQDNYYNYVFSSHCLEHLERPWEAVSEWYRVLQPNGILFLYLPHPNYIPWRPHKNRWHKWITEPHKVIQGLQESSFYIIEATTEPDVAFGFYVVARKETK
ncbi:MAG: hypothetical protein DRJ03_00905 [Chloroflexi bacterium]|nr:MAG: hypothetical protein DRJ03_00905 [Chloroflexota bacterium]